MKHILDILCDVPLTFTSNCDFCVRKLHFAKKIKRFTGVRGVIMMDEFLFLNCYGKRRVRLQMKTIFLKAEPKLGKATFMM